MCTQSCDSFASASAWWLWMHGAVCGGGAGWWARGAAAAREAARNWSGARAGQSLAAAGSDAPPASLVTQCTRCLAAASLRGRPSTTSYTAPDRPDAHSRHTRPTANIKSPFINNKILRTLENLANISNT